MSISNSFTYIISSSDRTNSIGTNTNTYDIDFGGFNSNCNDYSIEILNVLLSENTLQSNSMLVLVANDLADIGYFCPASLNCVCGTDNETVKKILLFHFTTPIGLFHYL